MADYVYKFYLESGTIEFDDTLYDDGFEVWIKKDSLNNEKKERLDLWLSGWDAISLGKFLIEKGEEKKKIAEKRWAEEKKKANKKKKAKAAKKKTKKGGK